MRTKDKRIDLKASAEDEKMLQKAASIMGETKVSKVIFNSVKNFAEQEPELFFCNRVAIRQVDQNIESGRVKLQSVQDEFLKITGKELTIHELQTLVSDSRSRYLAPNGDVIRELVITKLIDGKASEIQGIQLSEAKLREFVVIPDLSDLMIAIEQIMNVPEVNFREVFHWNAYEAIEGKISVIPVQVEMIKDSFRFYASTPSERQKLAKVRNLCETLTKFLDDKSIPPEKLNFDGVCYFDPESNRFEPSEQYVKFGITRPIIFNH